MSRTNLYSVLLALSLGLSLILISNMHESQLPKFLRSISQVVPMVPEPKLLCEDPAQTIITLDKGTIVRQLTNMNDWMMKQAVITTQFELQNAEAENWMAPFVGQKVQMTAAGTVMAGTSLAGFDEKDIDISADGKRLVIHLAPTKLYDPQINERLTYAKVENGVFVSNEDVRLSEEARVQAMNKIKDEACQSTLLQEAADRTQVNLEKLIKSFNPALESVDVVIDAGTCSVSQ
ncbi:MAG: DUF4230 domain-containing protein [Chloroflexales bacterium]|nr:DUF4230 domain-containing protein [Chloroflexales bacterium]